MPYKKSKSDLHNDPEDNVRDIVGRSYDREHGNPPERFNKGRALTVTAIQGAYEYASHVAIALVGTPTRGLVVISVSYSPTGYDFISERKLSPNTVDTLRKFIFSISDISVDLLPADFRWRSDCGVIKP